MAGITEMHSLWMKDPEYRKAYDALAGEFARVNTEGDSRKDEPERDSTDDAANVDREPS
jgi:hypothetical protein